MVPAVNNPRVWLVLWIILFVVIAVWLNAQHGGYLLVVGTVTATESEQAECSFGLGTGEGAATLALHPKGIPCVRMREFVGRTGTLFFVPDE